MGAPEEAGSRDTNVELKVLNKLVETIEDIKVGLDPEVLASWYKVIETEARFLAPPHLKEKISVYRDPVLPMKFRIKASKRVTPYVVEAIENNLDEMPFATRLYFQKMEEIIESEQLKPPHEEEELDSDPTLERL